METRVKNYDVWICFRIRAKDEDVRKLNEQESEIDEVDALAMTEYKN